MANPPELENVLPSGAAPASDDVNPGQTTPSIDDGDQEITFTGATQTGMYILLVGLIVGIVLSPWVLGRSMDAQGHASFYDGAGEQWKALNESATKQKVIDQQKLDALYKQFEGIDVTPVAVEAAKKEILLAGEAEVQPLFDAFKTAKQAHRACWTQAIVVLMIVVALLMFIEPVVISSGLSGKVRNQLALCRYLFMAGAIAMLLANPFLFSGSALIYVGAAIGFSLLLALLPVALKRRA